jgi:hypothetical protein
MHDPGNYVYFRDDLLFADGRRVYYGKAGHVDLLRSEQAIIDCVHRGESRFDILCRSLATLEIGGNQNEIGEALLECVADSHCALAMAPPICDSDPDVIICDFDSESRTSNGRALSGALRRRKRVVHLGVKNKVAGRSSDSMWFERAQRLQPGLTWFRFIQWARSFVLHSAHLGADLVAL